MTSHSWQSEFEDSFRGAHVLVTGATGFIGSRLSEVLTGLGSTVTGASRSAGESTLPSGVTPLALSLTDRNSVLERIGRIRYDLVFHLAAYVTARQDRDLVIPMLDANLLSTVHLLDALTCRGCGRLVTVGSSEEPVPSDGTAPGSPYAAAKSAATAYALMYHTLYNLPVVSIRLFFAYGPHQKRSKLVPYTICSLLAGKNPSLSGGEKTCDPIFLDDVVRALLKAATAPSSAEGESFDVGSGSGLAIRHLVNRVAELVGPPGRPMFGKMPNRTGESNQVADLSLTSSVLGWQPIWELRDGLSETIDWYRRELASEASP